MNTNLQFAAILAVVVLTCSGCAAVPRGPMHAAPRIVPASEWGGIPRTSTLPFQTVTQLTVHHQGERWDPDKDVPAYLRRLQQWSRDTKGWADVPYHYIIGPDGTIYSGRSPTIAGDTNTEYNPLGHLQVMLLGNFEEQAPTAQQWESAVVLLAQLLRIYDLPPSSIGAHRHRSAQTVCPGANLMIRFEELRAAVSSRASRL